MRAVPSLLLLLVRKTEVEPKILVYLASSFFLTHIPKPGALTIPQQILTWSCFYVSTLNAEQTNVNPPPPPLPREVSILTSAYLPWTLLKRERDNNLRSWAILSISIIPTRVLHHKPRLIVRSNFLFVNKIKKIIKIWENKKIYTHTHTQTSAPLSADIDEWLGGGGWVRDERRETRNANEPWAKTSKQTNL